MPQSSCHLVPYNLKHMNKHNQSDNGNGKLSLYRPRYAPGNPEGLSSQDFQEIGT